MMMKNKMILLMFLSLFTLSTFGQPMEEAKKVFGFFRDAKGDSIYIRGNDQLKAALNPQQLSGLRATLEMQAGKYKSHGTFGTEELQGITVYYCDVQFERMPLRFLVAFDPDGKLNTLRFVPVPAQQPQSNLPPRTKSREITETEISVRTGSFVLPGILTTPAKVQGRIPVVILVHGSGPNDKDETIGPNKPFRDLAWDLAERGISTIRYDKRSKVYQAEMLPPGEELTIDNEVTEDVLSAIRLAAKEPKADPQRIYIAGHSLGAMLAPRIAEQSPQLAGIILLAAPSRPIEDLLVEQFTTIYSTDGLSEEEKEMLADLKKQVANVKHVGTSAFDASIPFPFNAPASYWLSLKEYDQVATALKLTLPILFLQGERDYQVTMQDYLGWKQAFQKNKNSTFISYPALNHLFLEGQGKSTPQEYNRAGYVPAYVSDNIAGWIHKN